MKSLIRIVCVMMMTLCLAGCTPRYQYGYPSKIHFPKEGAEITLTGESFLSSAAIYNSKGHRESGHTTDIINQAGFTVTFDWLTFIQHPQTNLITLIATPNKTKKKRRLLIIGSAGQELEIVVTQSK